MNTQLYNIKSMKTIIVYNIIILVYCSITLKKLYNVLLLSEAHN
jgi:hypothetical protein